LQEFTTAIEQLALYAYTAVNKENIRKGKCRAFIDRLEDQDIKIQLLL
jgi:hypothetical protein